ncbi:hypothetical protein FVO59_11990 [Microbacterium esteraromaticum]|uniref:Uncharacterized protein n=1 Tax=Microbacterium esteraromaticum TaxID=57043 RepID=A0A7D8AKM6_9MICO|nr:hypothetical protein [Microbacterium esteraromaticum]QMU97846.1 hypothetical protein FVO59_11990 [Microbacterium esteraromaticum]
MSNLSTRIATRKMSHKDVPICLDLDLIDQRDDVMRALDAAHRAAKNSDERLVSGEHPDVSAARERVAELDVQIREASIILRVYGVDRHTYNQWIVECPPRKGRQEAFDSSTFFMHAAKNSAKYVDESGVEHEITPDEWVTIDKMTDGEYDRLAQAVLYVNRGLGQVDVGFFVNGSEPTTDS